MYGKNMLYELNLFLRYFTKNDFDVKFFKNLSNPHSSKR